MTLHIFNPEHDMALVANTPHWTSPHAGRNLREDLGWIPALWAKDGDVVIVDDVEQAQWYYRRLKMRGRKAEVTFTTMSHLAQDVLSKTSFDTLEISPWGWDKSIRHQLKRAGIALSMMPTDEQLDSIRRISGRQTTQTLMPYLRYGVESETCGDVASVKTVGEILEKLGDSGSLVVKSPWSCSGRGVRYLYKDEVTENQINWLKNSLRQQNELMLEPLFEKLIDFGMEFAVHDGKTQYEGLSLFDTANGAYTGSLLATEEEKREQMKGFISLELLDEMSNRICSYSDEHIAKTYEGPFGVDMMIVKGADGKNLLNPCVELNLRRTMGHTALALSPKERGNKQIMRIAYEGKHYHLRLFNNEDVFV